MEFFTWQIQETRFLSYLHFGPSVFPPLPAWWRHRGFNFDMNLFHYLQLSVPWILSAMLLLSSYFHPMISARSSWAPKAKIVWVVAIRKGCQNKFQKYFSRNLTLYTNVAFLKTFSDSILPKLLKRFELFYFLYIFGTPDFSLVSVEMLILIHEAKLAAAAQFSLSTCWYPKLGQQPKKKEFPGDRVDDDDVSNLFSLPKFSVFDDLLANLNPSAVVLGGRRSEIFAFFNPRRRLLLSNWRWNLTVFFGNCNSLKVDVILQNWFQTCLFASSLCCTFV